MSFIVVLCYILYLAAATNAKLIGELPEEVREDLLSIFLEGRANAIACVLIPVTDPIVEYWVYTQDNTTTPTIQKELDLNITSTRSKIIFLTHGWRRDANAYNIVEMKDAYLKRYDAFVIIIDWSEAANNSYARAKCTLPKVASNVANSLCEIVQKYNVSLESLHLLGHSLGAHVFGIAGQLVKKKCGQIGRITGLDPAGVLYQSTPARSRLDPSDALFVDIIHTSIAGYNDSCGHIDSYANCGYNQPGCLKLITDRDILKNTTAILELPEEYITCDHERSATYFAESINSDRFVAQQCIGCGKRICFRNIFSHERKIIGEDCTTPGHKRNYVFYTNVDPPFAKG